MLKKILILSIALSYFQLLSGEDNNPFVPLLEKTYPEYREELNGFYVRVFNGNPDTMQTEITQFYEMSGLAKTPEWKLNARFFDCVYRLYKSRKGNLIVTGNYTTEQFIADMQSILIETQQHKIKHLEIDALFQIAEAYRLYLKNYEQAFEYYMQLDKTMQNLSEKDYPLILQYTLEIGAFFFYFKDYRNAIVYFGKVPEKPVGEIKALYGIRSVYNNLGLSYLYGYNDLDRADHYFNLILKDIADNKTHIENDEIWEGIAKGNLGRNLLLRGKYDEALPLLLFSLDRMIKYIDYSYAAGKAIDVATIYLDTKRINDAKKYLDDAKLYIQKSQRNDKKKDLFPLLSKYYALTGNTKLSMAYLDSTVTAAKSYDDEFDAIKLRYAEQRMHRAETQAREEALQHEKEKSTNYFQTLIIAFTALLLLSLLSILLIIMYRRKRAAYRALTMRIQQWAHTAANENIYSNEAGVAATENTNGHVKQASQSDYVLIDKLNEIVEAKKLFTNSDMTLDILAEYLNCNRVHLSQAINRVTGKNFNQYINEYRVREAILILSNETSAKQTIDAIAYESGFNDRRTFYRVFKSATGLSPTDFRNNLPKKE